MSRAGPGLRRPDATAPADAVRRALADLERAGRAGPPWLVEARNAALERFEQVGWPTVRDEDWRYTNVAPIARLPLRAPVAADPAAVRAALAPHVLPGALTARLVFVDGRFEPSLSTTEPLPSEVYVGPLSGLLAQRPELAHGRLARVADASRSHAFVALGTALFEEGAAVVLPARACLPAPIDLVFARTGAREAATASVRLLVLAGEGARATVVERHLALTPGAASTHVVAEVDLAAGAHVEHVAWQEADPSAFHVSTTQVVQARDSLYLSHAVSLGAALARSDLNVVLAGEGAECALHGLYVVDGARHVDHHTRIDHTKPRGTSRQTYKGVLAGAGHAVFNGRIVVHLDAQKTDAQQGNHNLLLSDDAAVDTKPQLEIFADDVKCAHGTTVGQLEADPLFYLRSRGLDLAAARAMLVRAFAKDVTDRVDVPVLRPWLETRLDRALPDVAR